MLLILSPTKTMQDNVDMTINETTLPLFLEKANQLHEELKNLTVAELARTMQVNPQLAQLNYERFQQWHVRKHKENGIPAFFSYLGEVFRGLHAADLRKDDLLFAQNHVRILSGFYGILRPLDLVLPYRLEMGGRFAPAGYSHLYGFWKKDITQALKNALQEQGDQILINLASNEYYKVIDKKQLAAQIITPVFKEARGDGYKMITIYAKKARGMMTRFIIQNRLKDTEQLKLFDQEGYYYNENLSTTTEIVFTR